MPISDVYDALDPESPAERIAEAFRDHLATAAEACVAKPGRGRGRWSRSLLVSIEPGESLAELASAVAVRLVELAEEHAGDKRSRYSATLLGRATENRKAPVLAGPISFLVHDDDDDDSPARATGGLVRDLGGQHVRLVDASVGLVERLLPLTDAAQSRSAAAAEAEARMRVELRRLEIDYDREQKREAHEAAIESLKWSTIGEVAKQYQGVATALAEALAAKLRKDLG